MGGDREEIPADQHHWMVYCIDWDSGEVRWKRQAHQGQPKGSHHLKNTFASETPVTDGERLYVYFGNLGVFCYDMNGELVWSKLWKPVKTRYGWGTAASPVLHQDRLYIVNDNDDQSFLLALDKKTGEELWRTNRDEDSNWATPLVWENELRTEIVTPGTDKVRSYGLDGSLLWELGGMSTITIPTPFSEFGLVYIASGYFRDELRPVYAVRPGASGDITLKEDETSNSHIVWSQPQAGPYNPSPLVYGEYYYTLLDHGFVTCHRLARANWYTASVASSAGPVSSQPPPGPTAAKSSVSVRMVTRLLSKRGPSSRWWGRIRSTRCPWPLRPSPKAV